MASALSILSSHTKAALPLTEIHIVQGRKPKEIVDTSTVTTVVPNTAALAASIIPVPTIIFASSRCLAAVKTSALPWAGAVGHIACSTETAAPASVTAHFVLVMSLLSAVRVLLLFATSTAVLQLVSCVLKAFRAVQKSARVAVRCSNHVVPVTVDVWVKFAVKFVAV